MKELFYFSVSTNSTQGITHRHTGTLKGCIRIAKKEARASFGNRHIKGYGPVIVVRRPDYLETGWELVISL